jgi:hypothetical protein
MESLSERKRSEAGIGPDLSLGLTEKGLHLDGESAALAAASAKSHSSMRFFLLARKLLQPTVGESPKGAFV